MPKHEPMPFRNHDTRTGKQSRGDSFPGETLLAELMAAALAQSAYAFPDRPGSPRRVMDAVPDGTDFGFNTRGWLAKLRERGYTITVDTDSVTFTIVRG